MVIWLPQSACEALHYQGSGNRAHTLCNGLQAQDPSLCSGTPYSYFENHLYVLGSNESCWWAAFCRTSGSASL